VDVEESLNLVTPSQRKRQQDADRVQLIKGPQPDESMNFATKDHFREMMQKTLQTKPEVIEE
jgi:hypothetical protein